MAQRYAHHTQGRTNDPHRTLQRKRKMLNAKTPVYYHSSYIYSMWIISIIVPYRSAQQYLMPHAPHLIRFCYVVVLRNYASIFYLALSITIHVGFKLVATPFRINKYKSLTHIPKPLWSSLYGMKINWTLRKPEPNNRCIKWEIQTAIDGRRDYKLQN